MNDQFIGDQFTRFLNLLPVMIVILDDENKLVFANNVFLQFMQRENPLFKMSSNLGEILQCSQNSTGKNYCFGLKACESCGLQKAVKDGKQGVLGQYDVSIESQKLKDLFHFRVHSQTYTLSEKSYTALSLFDISHELHRKSMERIFFHDVLNMAGLIYGLLDCMLDDIRDDVNREEDPIIHSVLELSEKLIDEIKIQRELQRAETNELVIKKVPIQAGKFFAEIIQAFSRNSLATDKQIELALAFDYCVLQSDPTILRRIIINMMKNALEASPANSTIVLGAKPVNSNQIRIWVQNPGVMDATIQSMIFQRSFSTKDKGRGIGTYSMKLLGEKYLKGKIGFESSASQGTTFYLELDKE